MVEIISNGRKQPMTQTNTTQNGNAINRIIERTDEITKRELSGNDPSYKIGDNPNEFYQNGTLPVQNASTQPTTQNKEELQNNLGKIVDKYIVPRTIKKRELFALRWGLYGELEAYYKDVMARSNEWWNQKLKQSISQAHQSGIEEERKRIIKVIESFIDPNPVFLEEHREKIFLKEVIKSLKENKQ